MRPLLLKGHERSITSLKYNREGDLLFTTSKSPTFAVWYTDNGERLGTYEGHTGAVWMVDVDRNSEKVISGAADNYVKSWDAEYGRNVSSWLHSAPVRAVQFALGDKTFLSVTDQVMGNKPTIHFWDSLAPTNKSLFEIVSKSDFKILGACWGPLNDTVYTANEDGTVRIYDARNGKQLECIAAHKKSVMQLAFDKHQNVFVTASKDGDAKLYDAKTFQHLKTYTVGRAINSANISSTKPHVIMGGGQSAESVTTTRVESAQFRVRFFHLIYAEELGSVQGHFGPVNVLSFSPDGTGFASGGEDGYVRLHHFDESYFTSFSRED